MTERKLVLLTAHMITHGLPDLPYKVSMFSHKIKIINQVSGGGGSRTRVLQYFLISLYTCFWAAQFRASFHQSILSLDKLSYFKDKELSCVLDSVSGSSGPRNYAANLNELLRATMVNCLDLPFIDFVISKHNCLHETYLYSKAVKTGHPLYILRKYNIIK